MVINLVLIFILAICVITDLKNRKIYNHIIFPGLLSALIIHFVLGGWQEVGTSLLGLLVGLGILLIPYLMSGMGAGDVKLLALVGAFKGISFVLVTSIYMALLGGILAICVLLFKSGFKQRMQWLFAYIMGRRYGLKLSLGITRQSFRGSYPYGLAIAGGAMLSLFL